MLHGFFFNIGALWRRLTSSRYTRELEAEVILLRAENRAMLNSILGIAGIPPVIEPLDCPVPARSDVVPQSRPAVGNRVPQSSRINGHLSPGSRTNLGAARDTQIALPLRRRSWQQITRMLEFESARSKVEG